MGIVAPPPSAGIARRIGGILLLILAVILAILLGWAIVQLIALPFGGIGTGVSFFWGFLLVCIVLGGLIVYGRRRQKRARDAGGRAARRAVQALTRTDPPIRAIAPRIVSPRTWARCCRPRGWTWCCSRPSRRARSPTASTATAIAGPPGIRSDRPCCAPS